MQLGGVGRTDDMTVLWILCLGWKGSGTYRGAYTLLFARTTAGICVCSVLFVGQSEITEPLHAQKSIAPKSVGRTEEARTFTTTKHPPKKGHPIITSSSPSKYQQRQPGIETYQERYIALQLVNRANESTSQHMWWENWEMERSLRALCREHQQKPLRYRTKPAHFYRKS